MVCAHACGLQQRSLPGHQAETPSGFARRALRSVQRRHHSAAECSHNSNAPTVQAALPDRRGLLTSLIAAPILLQCRQSRAEGANSYSDDVDKYQIEIPEGWQSGTGNAPGNSRTTRRALAWFPEGNVDTNISVIVTNVGADFTSLGSFGDAQGFGENLVSSMDRSFLLRTPEWTRPKEGVQLAELLNAKQVGKNYFVEYTVTKPKQSKRHLLSLVALGNNGRYNRLYTATAQCPEEDLGNYKPALEAALKSFKPPGPIAY
ncbi:hypothetical protein WJX73_005447 [Symbiochloris irregularis]|uniref:PsbP C-terminal domain-containing protein n=1 Tax=Symbiochloris irregularis TaxID=706552 RepID=A0AAW1NU32_9CHLO